MGHVVVDYRRVSFVLSGVAGPTNMREEVWWWEGNMRPRKENFNIIDVILSLLGIFFYPSMQR